VNSGGIWRMPNFSYAGIGQLADYAQRRVLDGGTIEITGNTHSSGQNFTTASAGGTFRYTPSGQTLTLSGNANSNLPLDGPLTFDTIGHITVSEAITGTGSLTKTGPANLVLQGSNIFTGPVILSAGHLIFDGVNTENGVPELILNGGTFYLGSAFAGGTATFGALSGSGAINMAYGATTGTRTLSIHQSSDSIYSGVISNASGSRFAGLAKSGNGALTLTGASTYTGATSVNGGILRVNGSLGNTATTVAAAGILGGSGSISGAVTVHGTLAPGNNTVGTLATGALTLAPGARVDWEMSDWTGAAGAGQDTIVATSLDLTATAADPVVIRLIGASPANFSESTARFTLVQTTGGISGFSSNQFVIDPGGFTLPQGTWTVEQSDKSLVLVYSDYINPDANQNDILDTWETDRFGNADAGMNGADEDPDHDGLTNLMEFALDTHPLQSGASPLIHTLAAAEGGAYLQLEVLKNPLATNLDYRLEVAGDLNGPWSSDALTAVEIIRDDVERLIARDRTPVADAARRFIRLRVTTKN
jgi:autotransporter-associated beta strand protein